MKKIKERKKAFIRKCKNGTVFYLDTWGSKWNNYEPFNILYVKHNQHFINRDGFVLRISGIYDKGYEVSPYLFEDIKKAGYVDIYHLEQNIKDIYQEILDA